MYIYKPREVRFSTWCHLCRISLENVIPEKVVPLKQMISFFRSQKHLTAGTFCLSSSHTHRTRFVLKELLHKARSTDERKHITTKTEQIIIRRRHEIKTNENQ